MCHTYLSDARLFSLMPLVRHGDCLLCSPMETAPYHQRDPKASPLYQLAIDHYEGLKEVYSDRYEETYGPQQGHWENAVSRFLKCGDLFYGFARVWCSTCRDTYLVPLTCRSRGLCPW